jgi:predicted RNA-binding protein with TRAM domain
MLEEGQTTPIMVRPDGEEGVGEMTIEGYVVQARKH